MAFVSADRVSDTTTVTGTGNVTVSGVAPTGYQTLSAVLSVGDTFYYCISDQTTGKWETGTGTYVSANVFARTTVLSSSNSGSLVAFTDGTKTVFVTFPAAQMLQTTPGTVGASAINVVATGSTTARTLAARFADVTNVLDWGASPSASASANTTAITAAINSIAASGGIVFFPAGSYLCNPISISNAFNVSLVGEDRQATTLLLATTGNLLTFSNAQNCFVSQMTFQISGTAQAIANTYGLVFNSGGGNCQVDSCWFVAFANDGLSFSATSGNQMSGNQVTNCIFVGNGGNQLSFVYSGDFRILNNQFGSLSGVAAAAIGCYLNNSSAGLYTGNYHWSNVIGFSAVSCNYNTYSLNRFEINNHQGAYFNTGVKNQFTNNKIYSNSLTGNGLYDNVYFIDWAQGIVNSNHVFRWDSTNSKWGMYFDSGCNDIQLKNNKVGADSFGASYGPYNVVAANDSNVYGDFEVLSCTTTTVSAGVNIWLGPVGQNYSYGAASFQIGKQCEILRLWIGVDTAPGAGKTFTYTIYVNGVATAMTGTISGASSYNAIIYNTTPAVLAPINSTVSIYLTTDAGAATANHRYYIEFLEY
jgi:hypothetical protein